MPRAPKRGPDESDSAFESRYHAYLAAERERLHRRYADPVVRAKRAERVRLKYQAESAVRLAMRERRMAVRAPPPDHPGTCDLCGVRPKPRCNGTTGINQDHRHDNNVVRGWLCTRCNTQVAVLDLAFTDPDRFALLKAWSLKHAPAVRATSTRPDRRKKHEPDPTLFDLGYGP